MILLKDFNTLYIYRKNKKIYKWHISVVNDNTKIYIQCIYGEIDGKLIINKKEILKGKGKKSIIEQAIFDANSRHRSKIDKEGYVENQKDLDKLVIRPMLASKFDREKYNKSKKNNIIFPAIGQIKYDGIRCLIYMKDNNIIMESRNGIHFMNFNHIREEALQILTNDKLYLDGELYSDTLSFEILSGLTHLKKENNEKQMLETYFITFDCINLENMKEPFQDRYEKLEKIIKNKKYIKLAQNYIINNIEDVDKLHLKFTTKLYEGLILRNIKSVYEIKKRSKNLQKYKTFIDEEFEIIGYHEGEGNDKGTVIWECITNKNKKFSVRPKGTREYRSELLKNGNNYIGKLLTVIFQEYTADEIPRFPVGKSIRIE